MDWALLAGVPDDEVRELLRVARRRRFARNEVVFHRDDPGDSLHLIQKGRFSLRVATPLGDVATIAVLGPGDSFGEMALLAEEPLRSATVTALEDAETFAVHRAEFEQLRSRHPGVDRILLRFLAGELRRVNERMLEALYVSAEKRTLRRLVELADLYRSADGEIVVTLTQESIAELAGVARPTVNSVLREEEKRGTIALERGRTRIVDLAELERRAR
ncbi:MAG TPA: Crp/Fnr family transcriptional regulator [Gaiellaceae bacterium]|nr:Crp/Fnr family transcriptional regulator [Gaiellaceae bacterium]